jgi:putative permease
MFQPFRDWKKKYLSDPQFLILAFLLIFGFLAVFWLGNMLTPVFAALVIAYLLDGMVTLLERFRIPHIASVLIVFFLFIAFLFILSLGLLPLLSRQIAQLVQQIPEMVAGFRNQLILLPQKYPEFISEPQINRLVEYLANELTRLVQRFVTYSLTSVRGIITILVYLILMPLLVFFFLKDKKLILKWITTFLPKDRGLATEVWQDVNQQILNYVRGKAWEILIVWGATYGTFFFLKLQYAMLLALFVGLSVLVPYIGATFMFLPVSMIAYFQWGWGPQFAWTLIAYTIIQILDGNLLVPILFSEVVNLHPVAIIVAVLVFGGMWGIWGLFFAIPLATLVQAVIKAYFRRPYNERQADKRPKSPLPT